MKTPGINNLLSAAGLLALLMASTMVTSAQSVASADTRHAARGKTASSKPATAGMAVTQNRDSQAALTPAQALEMLRAGNARFASGKMLRRDLPRQVRETAAGQYPFASLVSCLDSRTSSELLFDQGLGDIFNARVAGNIVNEDILGSLEFASKVTGSKLIVVIGHTNCGAIKGAIDDVKLGNLTGLLSKIRPAIDEADHHHTTHTSKNHALVEEVAEINVRRMMQAIREKSPVLKEMLDKGEVMLVGGMYDLSTGRVTFYQK